MVLGRKRSLPVRTGRGTGSDWRIYPPGRWSPGTADCPAGCAGRAERGYLKIFQFSKNISIKPG